MRAARGQGETITPLVHPMDKRIVAALRERLPDLQAVYRYGSAGGPYATPESDIDLALLAGHTLTVDETLTGAAVINDELGQHLAGMVGFRNVLVHNYRELDLNVVRSVLDHRVEDLSAFAQRLIALAIPEQAQ